MPSETTRLDLVIREARRADIPEILRQRRGMYVDMGYGEAPGLDAMASLSEGYLSKANG